MPHWSSYRYDLIIFSFKPTNGTLELVAHFFGTNAIHVKVFKKKIDNNAILIENSLT
jgi:hypothetical protein